MKTMNKDNTASIEYDYESIGKELDQKFPGCFQKVWNRNQYDNDRDFFAKEFPDAIFKCDFTSMCWISFVANYLSDYNSVSNITSHAQEIAHYQLCSSFRDFFRQYVENDPECIDNIEQSQTVLQYSLERRNDSLTETDETVGNDFSSRTSFHNYFDGLRYSSNSDYVIKPKTKHAALCFEGDAHSITEITNNFSQSFTMAFNTILDEVNDWEYKTVIADDIHKRVLGIFEGKLITKDADEPIDLNKILSKYRDNFDDFKGDQLLEKKRKKYELRWQLKDSFNNDHDQKSYESAVEEYEGLSKQLMDMNCEITVYNIAGMVLLPLSEKGIFLAYYYARNHMDIQNIKFFLILVLMRLEILCGISNIEFKSNDFINPIPHILAELHYKELLQSDLTTIVARIRKAIRRYESEVYNDVNKTIDSIKEKFSKYSDCELSYFIRGGKKTLASLRAEDFKLDHLASDSISNGIEFEDFFFKKAGIDHSDDSFFTGTFYPYDYKYYDSLTDSDNRKLLLQYDHDFLIPSLFSTSFLFREKQKEELYAESFVYSLLNDAELWDVNAPQLSGNKSLEQLIGKKYDGEEPYPNDNTFKIFPKDMDFQPMVIVANDIRLNNLFVENLRTPLEKIHGMALCLEDCVWVNYFIDNNQIAEMQEVQLLDEDISRIRNKIYGNQTEKWIKAEFEYVDKDIQYEKTWSATKQTFQLILNSYPTSQLSSQLPNFIKLKDQFLGSIMDQITADLWKKYADELVNMITETFNSKVDIPVQIPQNMKTFLDQNVGVHKSSFLRLFDNTDGRYTRNNGSSGNQQAITFDEMLSDVNTFLSSGEYLYQSFVVNNASSLSDYGIIALEYMKGFEYLLNQLLYRPYYLFLTSRDQPNQRIDLDQDEQNGYIGNSRKFITKHGKYKKSLEYGTLINFFNDIKPENNSNKHSHFEKLVDFYETRGINITSLKAFMFDASKTIVLRNDCAHPTITDSTYAKEARYVTYSTRNINASDIQRVFVNINELITRLGSIFA